ncbi:MAG: hypothetical protein IPP88_22395 [Betaproteobacteria bacterium]|nr:hypothetical protein [Betaproteobacteria bacterium]
MKQLLMASPLSDYSGNQGAAKRIITHVIAKDEEDLFAKAILDLVALPAARLAISRKLRKALAAMQSTWTYNKALDNAFAASAKINPLCQLSESTTDKSNVMAEADLIEWTPEIQIANKLLKSWLVPGNNRARARQSGQIETLRPTSAICKHVVAALSTAQHYGPLSLIPNRVKKYLVSNPDFATETLLKATGMEPVEIRYSDKHLKTQLMLHGGAKNALQIQLQSISLEVAAHPIYTVTYA